MKRIFSLVRKKIGQLFMDKTYGSNFRIGLLNGLLPCGMVYMALTAAITTGSIIKSALFMAFFGLGTLPVMWAVTFFGSYIQPGKLLVLKKLYPVLMGSMGVLLLLRGMGLNIPYISPGMHESILHEVMECHK